MKGQQITVNGHFNGTNAQTGVERINFNGATFNGYLLGTDDYFISRSDPANRDCRRRQHVDERRTNAQQNFVAGEDGVNDEIIGGALQRPDLRRHRRQRRSTAAPATTCWSAAPAPATTTSSMAASTPTRWSASPATTPTSSTTSLDVVVEAAGAGTDTVADADGRALDRAHGQRREPRLHRHRRRSVRRHRQRAQQRITGGDLNDTLSGLGGNDTLEGGLVRSLSAATATTTAGRRRQRHADGGIGNDSSTAAPAPTP